MPPLYRERGAGPGIPEPARKAVEPAGFDG